MKTWGNTGKNCENAGTFREGGGKLHGKGPEKKKCLAGQKVGRKRLFERGGKGHRGRGTKTCKPVFLSAQKKEGMFGKQTGGGCGKEEFRQTMSIIGKKRRTLFIAVDTFGKKKKKNPLRKTS